jgi:hypothetical protein
MLAGGRAVRRDAPGASVGTGAIPTGGPDSNLFGPYTKLTATGIPPPIKLGLGDCALTGAAI